MERGFKVEYLHVVKYPNVNLLENLVILIIVS